MFDFFSEKWKMRNRLFSTILWIMTIIILYIVNNVHINYIWQFELAYATDWIFIIHARQYHDKWGSCMSLADRLYWTALKMTHLKWADLTEHTRLQQYLLSQMVRLADYPTTQEVTLRQRTPLYKSLQQGKNFRSKKGALLFKKNSGWLVL